jgi:hypothetical protein
MLTTGNNTAHNSRRSPFRVSEGFVLFLPIVVEVRDRRASLHKGSFGLLNLSQWCLRRRVEFLLSDETQKDRPDSVLLSICGLGIVVVPPVVPLHYHVRVAEDVSLVAFPQRELGAV